MENLKKQFKKIAEKANSIIIKRNNYFDSKSDNWQDSDKGQKYSEDTNLLEDAMQVIEEGIDLLPPFE